MTPARYVAVWIALVILATITLLASRTLGGGWGFALAFAIAGAKAGLVAAFFMDLAHGRPVLRIVFAVGVAFVLVLVLGVLADVATRSTASAYVGDQGARPEASREVY
jgi:caa(3)-type oxidase subunit IV